MKVVNYCVCCNSKKLNKNPSILMPFIVHRVFYWGLESIDDSWNLRDVKNGILYQRADTLQCKKCGHLFLDIRFDEEELARLYKNYRDELYVSVREKYEPGYKNLNEVLNQGYTYQKQIEIFLLKYLLKKEKILDFGGDSGKNTPFVKDKNNQVYVYDISNNKTIKGVKNLSKKALKKHKFDLIICSQVLEHIPFPKKVVKEITSYANKNTIIYFEVPYEMVIKKEKKQAFLHKRHWHEHINVFSKKSLSKLLEMNGLKILDKKEFKIKIVDSKVSILGIVCKKIK